MLVKTLYKNKSWEGLHEFSRIARSTFIPFGGIFYLPDEWEAAKKLADEKPLSDGGTWTVVCSLKNYKGEIEYFLENVLPEMISEPVIVEYRYEEWSASKFITVQPKFEN